MPQIDANILRKCLTHDAAETLINTFQDNLDILRKGVTYTYKDKTWFIQMGFDLDYIGKIEAIFFHVNSSDAIYGERFSYSKPTPHPRLPDYCYLDHLRLKLDENGKYTIKNTSSVQDKNKCPDPKFIKIVKEGHRIDFQN